MIVGLGDVVTSKEKRIDFDYDIDLSSIEISGEYPFVDPVTVYGSVEDKNGAFALEATIEATVTTACARCLREVKYDKIMDVSLILTRQIDNEEMDDIIFVETDNVELDDILVPELLLDLDPVVLCKPDCKGLCVKCGHDLNEGECGCNRKEVDPRLAVLQVLLNKRD